LTQRSNCAQYAGVSPLDLERGDDVLEGAVGVRHHRRGRRVRAGALHVGDLRRARPGQAVTRLVERGIEGERVLEVGRGLRDAALREPRRALPEQRGWIIRPQRERVRERHFRGRILAARKPQIPEIRMRFRERRVESQCRLELYDGELGLTEGPIGDRQMAVVRRCPRVGRHRAPQRVDGPLRIPELQAEHADAVECVGVARQVRVQHAERLGRASAVRRPRAPRTRARGVGHRMARRPAAARTAGVSSRPSRHYAARSTRLERRSELPVQWRQ
jgi:hypothetical protein